MLAVESEVGKEVIKVSDPEPVMLLTIELDSGFAEDATEVKPRLSLLKIDVGRPENVPDAEFELSKPDADPGDGDAVTPDIEPETLIPPLDVGKSEEIIEEGY